MQNLRKFFHDSHRERLIELLITARGAQRLAQKETPLARGVGGPVPENRLELLAD